MSLPHVPPEPVSQTQLTEAKGDQHSTLAPRPTWRLDEHQHHNREGEGGAISRPAAPAGGKGTPWWREAPSARRLRPAARGRESALT